MYKKVTKKTLAAALACLMITSTACPVSIFHGPNSFCSKLRNGLKTTLAIGSMWAIAEIVKDVCKKATKLFISKKRPSIISKIFKKTTTNKVNFNILGKISRGLASVLALGYCVHKLISRSLPVGPGPSRPRPWRDDNRSYSRPREVNPKIKLEPKTKSKSFKKIKIEEKNA
ncbi:hypothetical protein ACFLYU_02990 [Candidatus Dependentiae bacterium]